MFNYLCVILDITKWARKSEMRRSEALILQCTHEQRKVQETEEVN